MDATYGILIVDDEAYFRRYLNSCIDWEEYDFKICAEASNAEEALRILPDIRPDVILADIHMTGMDGIEFSRKVKKEYPFICIILITGFNEFEYAKQAVEIGVSNYISKPFEKSELINSILKVKETLRDVESRKDLILSLKKQCDDNIPVVREAVLHKLLAGSFGGDIGKAEKELNRLDLKLPPFPSAVVILESDLLAAGNAETQKFIEKRLYSITESECLSVVQENCLVGIVHLEKDGMKGYFKSSCGRIISEIRKMYGGSVSIGIGTVCRKTEQIPESYEKARIALKNKFLLGGNRVISYGTLKMSGVGEEMYPFGLKNDLLMYARLLDEDKVSKTINDIYCSLLEKAISIDFVLILYTELLSDCFSFLAEYGYLRSEVFGAGFSPFEEIVKSRTISEVNAFVQSVYGRVISFLKSRKKINSLGMVKKAKEYIDQNYAGNLTIKDIAAKVFFHPSYLRFLFKKEMGMTVNEYITRVRMEKAKELLQKGKSNTEAASLVGYADATYFSKCFKKYYKINPSEYEKSLNLRI
ncbi:response regulator [Caproicibacter fermentans]|uniref:Stage 0 sporulation protein A homolog n=1 Tax=Caproicibacter fermentans TaxID=2576756 RepID=A0A7G8T644_9FIRM|nr:response regulator [Caproicibacter fermentans]QNK39085.1 response regulator [Caproicibacter fermentans]